MTSTIQGTPVSWNPQHPSQQQPQHPQQQYPQYGQQPPGPPQLPPPPGYQQQRPPQPPAKGHWLRTWLFAGGALVLGIIIGSAGSSDDGNTAAPQPTVTVTQTAPTDGKTHASTKAAPKPTKAAPKSSGIGDGTYLVGKEIKPGTYRSDGATGFCYAHTEAKNGDVMEMESGSTDERVIIRISPNAYVFEAGGCGTWHRI